MSISYVTVRRKHPVQVAKLAFTFDLIRVVEVEIGSCYPDFRQKQISKIILNFSKKNLNRITATTLNTEIFE